MHEQKHRSAATTAAATVEVTTTTTVASFPIAHLQKVKASLEPSSKCPQRTLYFGDLRRENKKARPHQRGPPIFLLQSQPHGPNGRKLFGLAANPRERANVCGVCFLGQSKEVWRPEIVCIKKEWHFRRSLQQQSSSSSDPSFPFFDLLSSARFNT